MGAEGGAVDAEDVLFGSQKSQIDGKEKKTDKFVIVLVDCGHGFDEAIINFIIGDTGHSVEVRFSL